MSVPQNVLNFAYGSTAADWRQHPNGGGWIYKTAKADATVFLDKTVILSGNTRVYGNARVYGNTRVYGNARVYGDAWVSGDARVSGDAWDRSPLYIQGSRHAVTMCSRTELQIGCHRHDFAWWKANAVRIGKIEGYTAEQIKEYLRIIFFAARMAKNLPPEPKTEK